MPTVSVAKQLSANADTVWNMVGGWNTMPKWHPEVAGSSVEGDGLVRRVRLADGTEILERLEHFARAGRQYTYIITDSPLPLVFYRSTLRVDPAAEGALACWFTEFEAKDASPDEVSEMLRTFYAVGLDNVERVLADL